MIVVESDSLPNSVVWPPPSIIRGQGRARGALELLDRTPWSFPKPRIFHQTTILSRNRHMTWHLHEEPQLTSLSLGRQMQEAYSLDLPQWPSPYLLVCAPSVEKVTAVTKMHPLKAVLFARSPCASGTENGCKTILKNALRRPRVAEPLPAIAIVFIDGRQRQRSRNAASASIPSNRANPLPF